MAHDASDVVEWGSDDQPRLAAVAARLRLTEYQLRNTIAGTGAVVALLSLFLDWRVTTVGTSVVNRSTVMDLGAPGAAYLVGLMALAALCTTILFGQEALRAPLRLAALGWAGALFGVLLATAASLRTYGSGTILAIVGVGLLGLAIYLTDRTRPLRVTAPEPDGDPVDLEVATVKPFVYPGSVDPRD